MGNVHTTNKRDPVAPHPPLERYYSQPSHRRAFVSQLFDSTAAHYDWINRIMSLGSGIRHRRDALRRAGLQPGMTLLDVCTGSGQLARAATQLTAAEAQVVGLDASIGMLREARQFVSVPLLQGFAEELPIRNESFDMVALGYGLRHMVDLEVTFREFYRVLRPGGRLLMIELTKPQSRGMRRTVRFYIRFLIPVLARLMGRDVNTLLEYLWDTIDNCVPPETIIASMENSGFDEPTRFGQIELLSEYTATRR